MNNKLEKSKKLIQNVFLFFLASFIPKTISFFMVPLYTECLSTLEYGTIDLITTTVQLLLPILTLQVQDAILRFSVAGQDDPRKVFSIGLRIVSAGFVFLASATFLLTMLGVVDLNGAYIAFFLASYLTGALGNVVNYFLRALDKVKEITIASVITCLITVSCNLLFLLIFRWGVNGYLLANILGHVLSLLYLMLAARLGRYISFRINDSELTRRIIVFSLPMIVSAFSGGSIIRWISIFFPFSAASLQPGFWLWPIRFRLLSPPLAQPFPKRIPFRCCKISIQQIRMDSWGKAMRSSAFLWCCVPPP